MSSGISVQVVPPFENVAKAINLIKLGAALQRGMQKFAYSIEAQSKKVTPVDTGRLRSSISTDIGNLYARIAPHTKYAGFVHEGTSKMVGRPYMQWGLEAAKEKAGESDIVNELSAEVESAIKKV